MFASRLFPSIIPLLITLTLLATEFATQVIGKEENHIGKEHVVECDDGIGDTTLFTATIKSLLPGDSLLLGPCNYQFEDDYIIGYLNAPDSDCPNPNAEGVLIKGTGQNPDQTVLNAIIENFPVNVMFENLKINGIKSTDSVFFTEDMNGIYVLFRSCVLIAGDLSTAYMKTAVYAYNGKLTFIDSKIINGYPSATESVVGVSVEAFDERYFYRSSNKLTLMRSSIEYFPIGLLGGNWTADSQNSIQVHKTKLSSNTIKCCAYAGYIHSNGALVCDICPLDSQTMNTPEGKSKIKMNEMVDLLGADTFNTLYTLDLTISSRKVQTGGSTLGYKLLSAHPALPMYKDKQYHPGNAAPQYFQFDSSATFSNEKENRIGFHKGEIDANFDNPNKIKAFQSVDGKVWKNKPLKVKVKVTQVKNPKSDVTQNVNIYQVKIPKRTKLKILIAFGER